MKVYGIDFSSSPSKKKPIAVAECSLRGCVLSGDSDNSLKLSNFVLIESLESFQKFLSQKGPWVGGFDLPFSMPRDLIEYFDWPTDWKMFVDFYCSSEKKTLKKSFINWCDAKDYGKKFAYRVTDKTSKSSPAMRWVNPPVAWMMHSGMARMLQEGLIFPAHQKKFNSLKERQDIDKYMINNKKYSHRLAFEVYPALTARVITNKPYKNDDKNKDSPYRIMMRKRIINYLRYGKAGLSTKLICSLALQRKMIMDFKGDYLDSVICALQASETLRMVNFGFPRKLDPLEGWIALS